MGQVPKLILNRIVFFKCDRRGIKIHCARGEARFFDSPIRRISPKKLHHFENAILEAITQLVQFVQAVNLYLAVSISLIPLFLFRLFGWARLSSGFFSIYWTAIAIFLHDQTYTNGLRSHWPHFPPMQNL